MIYFTGDINLTDWYFNVGIGIGSRIEKGLNPFGHLNRKPDDIWVGNFEGVASSVSIYKGLDSEMFRVQPNTMMVIEHLDAYGFANNHAMQHGCEAYQQTIDSLEKCGCKVFGSNNKKYITMDVGGGVK